MITKLVHLTTEPIQVFNRLMVFLTIHNRAITKADMAEALSINPELIITREFHKITVSGRLTNADTNHIYAIFRHY